MVPVAEIKRKAFHHLGLLYLAVYAVLPRWVSLWLFALMTLAVCAFEFLRIRRPEVNEWVLEKFGGIHRESEITAHSAVFWTVLGCWLTMLVFTNPKIVMASLGFLVFGDTAAALGGKAWGKHPWPKNPIKTYEGSACFVGVSILWALFFVKPWVALPAALLVAWIEARPTLWNDNFWLPLVSGAVLSILNLMIGR